MGTRPAVIKAHRTEWDLLEDERLMALLNHYHLIRIDNDDNFAEKLTWCLTNCQNKFRDLSSHNGRAWYFQNEHDASMFALKWV
jgi:hypothetical protein